ncbi:hypothetical protein XENOCAPTIV_007413, partial [Xenoophorus captivus]
LTLVAVHSCYNLQHSFMATGRFLGNLSSDWSVVERVKPLPERRARYKGLARE